MMIASNTKYTITYVLRIFRNVKSVKENHFMTNSSKLVMVFFSYFRLWFVDSTNRADNDSRNGCRSS